MLWNSFLEVCTMKIVGWRRYECLSRRPMEQLCSLFSLEAKRYRKGLHRTHQGVVIQQICTKPRWTTEQAWRKSWSPFEGCTRYQAKSLPRVARVLTTLSGHQDNPPSWPMFWLNHATASHPTTTQPSSPWIVSKVHHHVIGARIPQRRVHRARLSLCPPGIQKHAGRFVSRCQYPGFPGGVLEDSANVW